MTGRKRILTAMDCGIPDTVPIFEYLFSRRLMTEMMGHVTDLYDGSVQIKMAAKLGIDATFIPINGFCGFEEEAHRDGEEYTDEWSVRYIRNGWPVMVQTRQPLKSRQDWERYRLPEPVQDFRLNMLRDAIAANETDLGIIAGFVGPFTMAYWYFFDLEDLSLLIYDDPMLIHEVMEAYTMWSLTVMQMIRDIGKIDLINISDDWGSTTSMLMSPATLREFFIPPFKKMVQGARSLGFKIMMHNDGRIQDVLDDLAATGIHSYHPVERAAGMELGFVKERYRGRLCPMGNVNNKTTLATGSPQDVAEETKECLALAKEGGGYILSSDHSIHDGIPTANLHMMIETARRLGRY